MSSFKSALFSAGVAILAVAFMHFYAPEKKNAEKAKVQSKVRERIISTEVNLTVYDTASFLKSIDDAMVLVEGGKFLMGGEGVAESCSPVHQVEVSKFYMSKYMLTVEQFMFFVKATGYKTYADTLKGGYVVLYEDEMGFERNVDWTCDEYGNTRTMNGYPVLYVNWQDAVVFSNWLSTLSGKKYRLPTEAEWEYAAKGGVKSKGYRYSGSNNLEEVAWYGKNSGLKVMPVGTRKPNELGLFDMSGNVWQWCSDWFSEDYYKQSPFNNPKGPATGEEIVCRGGCILSGFKPDTRLQMELCFRGKDEINVVANDATFRLARDF